MTDGARERAACYNCRVSIHDHAAPRAHASPRLHGEEELAWAGATPERRRALALIQRYGRSSLDFFKLWPDKTYAFLDEGASVAAYRSTLGAALSLGDPVGPAERRRQAAAEFGERMRRQGQAAVFVAALPDALPVYLQLGFAAREVGQEAVVDLEQFSGRTVRSPEIRRYDRSLASSGHRFERHPPPHPPELMRELASVNAAWLSLRGRREREFGLGRFARAYLETTPVSVLRDAAGRIVAFVNEAPCFRSGGTAIDLMRRRPDSAPGAMTHLMACVLTAAHVRGQRELSLGIAPFASAAAGGHALNRRAAHTLLRAAERVFATRGLQRFKAKFQPSWEPRYLVFQGGAAGLVRALAALAVVMHRPAPGGPDSRPD